MNYTRVNWKDYPETDTPITADNLNKMDKGISDINDAIAGLFDFDSTSGKLEINLDALMQ